MSVRTATMPPFVVNGIKFPHSKRGIRFSYIIGANIGCGAPHTILGDNGDKYKYVTCTPIHHKFLSRSMIKDFENQIVKALVAA